MQAEGLHLEFQAGLLKREDLGGNLVRFIAHTR